MWVAGRSQLFSSFKLKILEKVGENIVEVTINADGSWNSVNIHDVDKIQNKTHNCEKEQTEPQESTSSPDTIPNVVDLTNKDYDLDIMDICETEDRKPLPASLATGVQIEDDFWAGLYLANSRPDTLSVGADLPVLADAVSPVFNQVAEGHDNISAMHNQFSAQNPYNAILSDAERQQLFSRTPLNMPQVSAAPQNRVPTVNMSAPTHNRVPPANMSTHNRAPSQLQNQQYRTGILNDFRNPHLQHSLNPRSHQPMQPSNTQLPHAQQGGSQANAAGPAANSQQARVMASSHAARQGNSQAGIVWTAGATVYSEQARAIATALAARQSQSVSSQNQAGIVWTAGANVYSEQARAIALAARQSQSISSQNQTCVAATYFTADTFWGLTGEQRGPPVQAVSRTDELFNSQPDQNWRPTSRMRGSLSGQQLTDQVRQKLIMPSSQQVQSSTPQAPQPGRTSSPLDVLLANSRNAHNPSRP
ncbi:hypothetical protein TSUD_230270 [Trifolium subterraneum]|nr:hypothetical protein TSUD_230270 [Trifolium subterraneum]